MKWRKLGRVFVPDGSKKWMTSHAYLPTPVLIDNKFRIYIGFWDELGVKRIGFVDVSANDPTKILRVSEEPCLDVGEVGTFDSDGVGPSYVFLNKGVICLYYFGWQLLANHSMLPRYIFTGFAVSYNGGLSFERFQEVPVLDRVNSEKFIRSSCSIIKEKNNYCMWYTSSNSLINIHYHLVPSYTIYRAFSVNGIEWCKGFQCLDFKCSDEFGLSRPWVIKENGLYKMFYSIRRIDEGYTLGYAESLNGSDWERKDHLVGIRKSMEGWDSEMICFPAIADYNGNRYIFYNGNDYGKTGFGVAILEEK